MTFESNCFLSQLAEILENQRIELIKSNQEMLKEFRSSLLDIKNEIYKLKGPAPFSTLSDIYQKLDEMEAATEEYFQPHPYKGFGFHIDEDFDNESY